MKNYKISVEEIVGEGTEITYKNFWNDTYGRYPWWQKNIRGKTIHLAVCPQCNNPVQLIGLEEKRTEEKPKIYGKHYHKSVNRLAVLDADAMRRCAYYTKTKTRPTGKDDRFERIDNIGRDIIRTITNKYDRLVHIMKKNNRHIFLKGPARKNA